MKLKHIDHIGINVHDLAAAKAFFADFGFTVAGEGGLEGGLLDAVTGLHDAKTELVFMQTPDKQLNLELIKFIRPADKQDQSDQPGMQENAPNTPGIRHIAFVVDDLEETVATLKRKGREFFSEIQTYKDIYKLCYMRGPEGIILELVEEM